MGHTRTPFPPGGEYAIMLMCKKDLRRKNVKQNKRNKPMALLALVLAAVTMLGGCVVAPPGTSSADLEAQMDRLERELDDLSEKLERNLGEKGEKLERALEDIPSVEDRLSKVEVYDLKSGKLLRSIQDEASLRAFEAALDEQVDRHVDDLGELNKELMDMLNPPKNATPEYRFDAYAASVGKLDKGKLYKMLSVTSYIDSDVVTVEVAPEFIHTAVLSKSFLSFSFEMPREKAEELRKLATTAS